MRHPCANCSSPCWASSWWCSPWHPRSCSRVNGVRMPLPDGFRIVSGGQTGVDLAALDAAIELNIPHGGWCPRGRKNEEGVIPEKYALQSLNGGYLARTRANVRDSDATLVLTWGKPTGGTAKTIAACQEFGRPHLVVDFLAN